MDRLYIRFICYLLWIHYEDLNCKCYFNAFVFQRQNLRVSRKTSKHYLHSKEKSVDNSSHYNCYLLMPMYYSCVRLFNRKCQSFTVTDLSALVYMYVVFKFSGSFFRLLLSRYNETYNERPLSSTLIWMINGSIFN